MTIIDAQKEYVILIETAKYRGLNKTDLDSYYEKHHIIPKSIGGTNKINNLVLLNYREHVRAHYLLSIMYPDNIKIKYAYYMIINSPGSRKLTKDLLLKNVDPLSEEELDKLKNIKESISRSTSDRFRGKPKSSLHREKISKAKKGDRNPMFGKKPNEKQLQGLNSGRYAKSIAVIDPEGVEFRSIKECAKQYNRKPETIRSWINNHPEKGFKLK